MSDQPLDVDDGATPPYKVGGILIRGWGSENPQLFVMQPFPKGEGWDALSEFKLPRGSRQYLDENGVMQDARDAQTARTYAETLEPIIKTFEREMYEEAGIPIPMLKRQQTFDIGVLPYASSDAAKGTYPIYWFLCFIDQRGQDSMKKPADAYKAEWIDLDHFGALVEQGVLSPGYEKVLQEVMRMYHYEDVPEYKWPVIPFSMSSYHSR